MFMNPLLKFIRPNVNSWIQIRCVRPSIRIDKERFELTLNVKHYKKEELRVKARPEYVIVEGKQERKCKKGYVIRQFVRKFKLPHGCMPETMKIHLSSDGILKVTAPRQACDRNLPCETIVPISMEVPKLKTESLEAVQHVAEKKEEKKP